MKYFNPKQQAILRYLYRIERYAPAYEIAQSTNISLITVKNYLLGSLSKYVSRKKLREYSYLDKKTGETVAREIMVYKFKTELVTEYLKMRGSR